MKTLLKQRFFILAILLFPLWGSGGFLVSCSNDDDITAVEKLPKATQAGAGTFGCLVNGKAFVHNDGLINCFYQYVDGGYYFNISGKNFDNLPGNIDLGTINKSIEEGKTYPFLSEMDGNAVASVFFQDIEGFPTVTTNSNYTGELTITKLDFDQHIVSGTFWFNLKHPVTGDTIKIREGRFDSLFYQ